MTLEQLRNQGIWIFSSVQDLKKVVLPGGGADVERSIASFRFAVFDCCNTQGEEIAKEITNLLPYLPFRILVFSDNLDIERVLPNGVLPIKQTPAVMPKEPDQMMMWLWQQWLRRLKYSDELWVLDIYLEQQRDENPTKEWIESACSLNTQFENDDYPLRIRVWERNQQDPCIGDKNWKGHKVIYDRHGKISDIIKLELNKDSYSILDKTSSDFINILPADISSQR